jgi:aconitase B
MKEAAVKAQEAATEYCDNVKYGVDAGTVVSADYLKAVMEQEKAALQLKQADALENATALQLHYAAGYEIDYNK